MDSVFPTFNVSDYVVEAEETMGTKEKFWLQHTELGKCLFKQARYNKTMGWTGEDWSEKIAAELAQSLNLPHAHYELAIRDGQFGALSLDMLPKNTSLTHGNEILSRITSSYPLTQSYRVSEHTIDIVFQAVSDPVVGLPLSWTPPAGITTAIETFVGYLLLDAWIGNGDRHHENWGFIETIDQSVYLAPTYDHASCLGRELQDLARQRRLQESTIEKYTNKAHSAFFNCVGDGKSLLTIAAFHEAAQRVPKAGLIWLDQLEQIPTERVQTLLNKIPSARLSSDGVAFTQQALTINKHKLLSLRESLL